MSEDIYCNFHHAFFMLILLNIKYFLKFFHSEITMNFFQSLATGSSFQRVVYAGDNISRFICHSVTLTAAGRGVVSPENLAFNRWLTHLQNGVLLDE